jgi:hypothetical protein
MSVSSESFNYEDDDEVQPAESELNFDLEDDGESEDINSKRKRSTVDLDAPPTSEDDDSGYEKLPADSLKSNPAKKVKFLKKHNDNTYRPNVHFDDEDVPQMSDEDENVYEPDPAYQINEEALRKYNEIHKTAAANDKQYNFFQLSRLNKKKQQIVEATSDPKLAQEPGAKKAAKLITLQEAGKPARDEYLDLDSDNIMYLPCKPPDVTEVDDILGPSMATGTACFACTHGIGFPMMNGKLVENLERYIKEVVPNTDPILAAIKISHYYTTSVQAPTNRNLNGDRPLPRWEARQVYDCLTTHRIEPSFFLFNRLRQLQTHLQVIREVGMYSFDAGILADNREPCTRDIRVSKKYEASFFKTIELELKLYGKDPKKMLGHNDKLSIASTIGGVIGPKANTFNQQKITDIFSANKR